jgi:hypothetical protein
MARLRLYVKPLAGTCSGSWLIRTSRRARRGLALIQPVYEIAIGAPSDDAIRRHFADYDTTYGRFVTADTPVVFEKPMDGAR